MALKKRAGNNAGKYISSEAPNGRNDYGNNFAQHPIANFAADVRAGLTGSGQKELSSNYLYDELGSALFNAITLLPEYGLFRADERILSRHADEIARPSVACENVL